MRFCILVAAITLAFGASAGNLDRVDQVDLIELDAKTSRAHLLILLEEDRVNTRPAMKALFKKVNNYLDFAQSGQLRDWAPNADASIKPKIIVYGPRDATSGEMQNLAGLKLAGQKAFVEVLVLPYQPGIRPRPVPIRTGKSGGA